MTRDSRTGERLRLRGRMIAAALGVTVGAATAGNLRVPGFDDDVGWRIVAVTAAIVSVPAAAGWMRLLRRGRTSVPLVVLGAAVPATAVVVAGPHRWAYLAALLAAGLVAAAVRLHLRQPWRVYGVPVELRNWSTPLTAAAFIGGGLTLIGAGTVTGSPLPAVVAGVGLLVDGVLTLWRYRVALGPTLIGGALALSAFGVVRLLDGAVPLGVALVGCGVALAGLLSTVFLADMSDVNGNGLPLLLLALVGCGVALAGLGAAVLHDDPGPWGIALTGTGVVLTGYSATPFRGGLVLFFLALAGSGLALVGTGLVRVHDDEVLFGVSLAGVGVALVAAGVAVAGHRRHGAGTFLMVSIVGFGIALIGVGVAVLLDGGTLLGPALAGVGVAVAGGASRFVSLRGR